jgi:hypothetical protein
MKINQIIVETSTTSGSISTVAQPLGEVQARSVSGLEPAEKVMKGKAKKKGPYANSISESKKKIKEAELSEEDVILVPGQGRQFKPGFHKIDPDRAEREGETLKNSLHTIIRVATALDEELSTRDNFPEWVSEKIGATKGMLVSIADYLISADEMQHDPDAMEDITGAGVIAGGAQYEGKNVDRMVKHITKSEEKAGKSHDEAEDIAWATANKRGMLDNKNKKKRADEGVMDVLKNKFGKKPAPAAQPRVEPTLNAPQQSKQRVRKPAASSNPFGNMISQITQPEKPTFKPTSTGSVAQTSTGMIHAPKASNPNLKAQSAGAGQQVPVKQKLDPNRIMNGIMTLNDNEFKQVVDFVRNQIRKGRPA